MLPSRTEPRPHNRRNVVFLRPLRKYTFLRIGWIGDPAHGEDDESRLPEKANSG